MSSGLREKIYSELTPWQIVQIARFKDRPVFQDYLPLIFTDFIELHGDRCYSDDRALIGGFATMDERKVLLLGHNKGKNLCENIERNFGQAKPEGYRKALRLMKLAEKYNLPVVTFIDTQGAYPGLDAEERGQSEAIARNLIEMARLEVPIVTVVIGEGGSGGALGIGVADMIFMLQHSIYSVISPEGCAAILYHDAASAPQAAQALKITAYDLKRLGIAEDIILEPVGGAHMDYAATAESIKSSINSALDNLARLPVGQLLQRRFEKYSRMGIWEDSA
ncbi:MAG: acetyl-CoA carboxylase carboxyltransferase subunit alpha [Geobacteraceae bacterium]